MKHIYDPSLNDFVEDTPAARSSIYRWNQEWTGQSEFDPDPEPFATYEVEDIREYMDEEDRNPTDNEFPFEACWEVPHHPSSDCIRHQVARFMHRHDAEAFATLSNTARENKWTSDDSNFASLEIPEGCSVDCGSIRHGKYPQSRSIPYTVTFPENVTEDADGDPTDEIKGTFHFQVRGFSDSNVPAWDLAKEIQSVLDANQK
jgi:hypothetical protein